MSIEEQIIQMNSNNKKIVDNSIAIYNKGVEDGEALGRKTEYDTFWDGYQENGNRIDYRYAFAGIGWTEKTLLPKYEIKPTYVSGGMFYCCGIVDLKKHIEDNNIIIDLSKATNLESLFRGSDVETFGVIDTRGCSGIAYILYGCPNLKSIDKVILKDDGSQEVGYFATNCHKLENITIEGVIGKTGFTVQQSTKLSKNSWISIINALSSTTSGLSITGSLASVKKAFETSAGANDGNTSTEWKALTDTKTNWTISLV